MTIEKKAKQWADAVIVADTLEWNAWEEFVEGVLGLDCEDPVLGDHFNKIHIDPMEWDGISLEIHDVPPNYDFPEEKIREFLEEWGFDAFRAKDTNDQWKYILNEEAAKLCAKHHSGKPR